jgi:hypothetical protein
MCCVARIVAAPMYNPISVRSATGWHTNFSFFYQLSNKKGGGEGHRCEAYYFNRPRTNLYYESCGTTVVACRGRPLIGGVDFENILFANSNILRKLCLWVVSPEKALTNFVRPHKLLGNVMNSTYRIHLIKRNKDYFKINFLKKTK